MIPKLSILFLLLLPACINQNIAPTQPAIAVAAKAPACKSYFNQQFKKDIYTQVEIEPEYPGGEAAFQRFLNRNIRATDELATNMIDDGISPRSVKVKFIVKEDGTIIHPSAGGKTDTSAMNGIEKEFFRMVKLMGKWTPGICNGKAVPVEINRPLVTCILLETEE